MKQSEFKRWLESYGVEIWHGTNHLKLRYQCRQSVMPRHPWCDIKEPLRKAIVKQLGLNLALPKNRLHEAGNDYALSN